MGQKQKMWTKVDIDSGGGVPVKMLKVSRQSAADGAPGKNISKVSTLTIFASAAGGSRKWIWKMGTLSFYAFEKSPNCNLLDSCEFYGIAARGVTGKLRWKIGWVFSRGKVGLGRTTTKWTRQCKSFFNGNGRSQLLLSAFLPSHQWNQALTFSANNGSLIQFMIIISLYDCVL